MEQKDNQKKSPRYIRLRSFVSFVLVMGCALGSTAISYFYKDSVMVMLWSLLILHMVEIASLYYLHVLDKEETSYYASSISLAKIMFWIAFAFGIFLLILEIMTWFIPSAALFPNLK